MYYPHVYVWKNSAIDQTVSVLFALREVLSHIGEIKTNILNHGL